MWVPLAARGRIIGGLGIADARKNYFTAHHANLALSVANRCHHQVNAELYGMHRRGGLGRDSAWRATCICR